MKNNILLHPLHFYVDFGLHLCSPCYPSPNTTKFESGHIDVHIYTNKFTFVAEQEISFLFQSLEIFENTSIHIQVFDHKLCLCCSQGFVVFYKNPLFAPYECLVTSLCLVMDLLTLRSFNICI